MWNGQTPAPTADAFAYADLIRARVAGASVARAGGQAAAIMPAPTVSFVASSMRMNEPVERLRA